MTRYKGIDWLLPTITKLQKLKKFKHVKLLFAGGRAPSQEGKPHYERFFADFARKCKNDKNVHLTGFIAEKDIAGYIVASDLMLLPYRGVLGASGSWAHALAHGKPSILSRDLNVYLAGEDAQRALNEAGLTPRDLLFSRHTASMSNKLLQLSNKKYRKKLATFSQKLAQMRTAEKQLPLELATLYTYSEPTSQLEWNYVAKLKKSFGQMVFR